MIQVPCFIVAQVTEEIPATMEVRTIVIQVAKQIKAQRTIDVITSSSCCCCCSNYHLFVCMRDDERLTFIICDDGSVDY